MPKITVSLSTGELLRIAGPAKLKVAKGKIMILGAIFYPGDEVEIHRYRSYGVKAIEDSEVEIGLQDGGSLEQPAAGEEVLDEWVETVDKVLDENPEATILAVGPTDAGKSSFIALAANRAIQKGLRAAVIDADIGQADVGPPGFISAAFVDKPILWLRWLKAEELRFVGSITPARLERRIISSVVELHHVMRKKGANVVAIDSDGWIHGLQAIEYKVELIKAVKPDVVAVIGDKELGTIFSNMLKGFNVKVLNLRSPAVVRTRDRSDRRLLRSEAYARYFENSSIIEIDLNNVSVIGSCLFSGTPLDETRLSQLSGILGVRVLRGAELPDALVLVVDRTPKPQLLERIGGGKQVYTITAGSEKGIYVAVLDKNLKEQAPGIIVEIDYSELKAKILTSYKGEIGGIAIGSMKLSFESGIYEEAGRLQRCAL